MNRPHIKLQTSHTLAWISNSKFGPHESGRRVLAEHIWNQFVGAGQRVVKAEPFGNHTAVLWDVLFVFSILTGAIAGGFQSLVFRGPCRVVLTLRGTGHFFREKQVSEVPLL